MPTAVIIFQSRGLFLQLFLIYLILCTVPLGLGAVLVFAPVRGGNFLSDAFALFPEVLPGDTLKKVFYRLLGLALMGISFFYARQVFTNIARPIWHYVFNN